APGRRAPCTRRRTRAARTRDIPSVPRLRHLRRTVRAVGRPRSQHSRLSPATTERGAVAIEDPRVLGQSEAAGAFLRRQCRGLLSGRKQLTARCQLAGLPPPCAPLSVAPVRCGRQRWSSSRRRSASTRAYRLALVARWLTPGLISGADTS